MGTVHKHPKADQAPRPSRASFARSLWDALHSINGPASVEEIMKIIPATDDADRWTENLATLEHIHTLLCTFRNHGYFCSTPDDKWKIATLEYYNERLELKKESRKRSARQLAKGERSRRDRGGRTRVVYRWVHAKWVEILLALLVGFIIGFGSAIRFPI